MLFQNNRVEGFYGSGKELGGTSAASPAKARNQAMLYPSAFQRCATTSALRDPNTVLELLRTRR
jgi:hypothetical protein